MRCTACSLSARTRFPASSVRPEAEDDSGSDSDMSGDDGVVIGPNGKKVKGKGGSSCHQCKSRRNFTALTCQWKHRHMSAASALAPVRSLPAAVAAARGRFHVWLPDRSTD